MDPISTILAEEIANDLVQGEGVSTQAALDPATILAIGKTLLTIGTNCVSLLNDINKVRNPNLIQRVRLKRVVKSQVRENLNSRIHLRMLFGSLEKSIVNSILRRAKNATVEEVNRLIVEAKLAV